MATFGTLLETYRVRADLSMGALARGSMLDSSMVSRLESAERHPSRAVVLTLAWALELSGPETTGLLLSAGYAPDELPAALVRLTNVLQRAASSRCAVADLVRRTA